MFCSSIENRHQKQRQHIFRKRLQKNKRKKLIIQNKDFLKITRVAYYIITIKSLFFLYSQLAL